MNCSEFKNNISGKLGDLFLTEVEQRHIQDCHDCAEYYRELQLLNESLSVLKIEPISTTESAKFQYGLDNKIDNYINRAFGFYRFAVRYGVAISAVFLLMFISFIPQFSDTEYQDNSDQVQYTYMYDEYINTDEEIDEEYINIVIDDFSDLNGYNAGEMIIGELNDDEFEYLIENIDVGGLL
jgi:hypothetical protein